MHHSIRAHIVAPIWLHTPSRIRWAFVHLLDRSKRQCWSDLVDAALATPEDDACDVEVPSLLGERGPRCASVCEWMHVDHTGTHACTCYCGKFRFTAPTGPTVANGASDD